MEPSFWDDDVSAGAVQTSTTFEAAADVAIVGGGLLGCCVARYLEQQAPRLSVVVIERGRLPTGASTRNAGFACFGSVGEIAADIDRMGPHAARDLVERRVRGLGLLFYMVDRNQIDYRPDGGNEIFMDDDPVLDRIDEINHLLAPIFPAPPFQLRDDLISSSGLASSVKHLVHTPFEGALHSGKLLQALRPGNLLCGEVTSIHHAADGRWQLAVGRQPLAAGRWPSAAGTVLAERVVVCTNAWLSSLLPDLEVVPARGQILITKPLPNLSLRGTFHLDQGFVYFRNVGNRVLLGGARNRAFEAERTTVMETTPEIQAHLEGILREVILPGVDVEIDRRWAGVMAFTPDHQPFVREVGRGLWAAMTCNGMGVALAAGIAAEVASVVLQDAGTT
jgi:glycine/D-amino acid oxidase-like deaminating enzyme